MPDVVVIGGGIVGAGAAYRLARAGARVTLVDRADTGHATAAGAGIVSPGTSVGRPPAYHVLVDAAVAYYREVLAQLAEDGEPATGYDRCGAIFITVDDAETARLGEIEAQLAAKRAAGVANIGEVTRLDARAARELFPALGDIQTGLHVAGAARVNGRLMRDALRRGATIRPGSAELQRHGDRVTGVRVDGETISAGAVVIAGGAWSGELASALGFRLPVYPQRGQILHLDLPGTDTGRWPIITGFHSHYLLTFPANRVVAGATREDGPGFDYRATAGGVHEALGEALRVAPGLASATLHEIRIGFRPASPDQLPMLGVAPGLTNVWLATGHGPAGLTLGPHSGAVAADLALGQPAGIDLAPYDPARFQG